MTNAPARPATLDETAEWQPLTSEWRRSGSDSEGRAHGLVQSFRADGGLCAELTYVHGRPEGAFRRFHPSGELARHGCYKAGQLDGELVATASLAPTTERLRSCCVPPGAWTLRARYSDGRLLEETFFDREGRRLLPDGSIHPDRPESVDPEARFTPELGRQWVRGQHQKGERHGRWRFWAESGEPLLEAEYAAGQAVGRWTHHALGLTRELGAEIREIAESPAFTGEQREPEHWSALARTLFAEGRPAEALCSLARTRDAGALTAALAEHTLVRDPAQAEQLVRELGSRATTERVANTLLLGATPSLILQRLSRSASGALAFDLIDAAILLDPERTELYASRATLHLQSGALDQARADLERLDPRSSAAAFLTGYVRVSFWPFDFGPAQESLGEQEPEELPDEVLQPLAAITGAIGKCALRIGRVREALLARGLAPGPWFPPDLSGLHGDVELGRWQFEIVEDAQPVTIDVDETVALAGLDVPALLRRAHADYAALCWICWGAGLDRVALPSEIRGRPELRRALATAALRYWQCQDRRQTSGLRARMQGAPSFAWRGLSIDELTGPVLDLATDAYREMRAALFWLADPECQSLWQDDLRPE